MVNEEIDGEMNKLIDCWTGKKMNGYKNGEMSGKMNEWMNEWNIKSKIGRKEIWTAERLVGTQERYRMSRYEIRVDK